MMLETVADHEFAAHVGELQRNVERLTKELKEQKDLTNDLFCAIKILSDRISDQNDISAQILREIQNK